jgi:hypothetical protein
VFGSSRFDLGFYAGRVFGLIAASFLLVMLVIEMAKLYAGAMGDAAKAEKKLAEMELVQAHPSIKIARGERPESFIHRRNVDHYRSLLESGKLDAAGREAVEKLLRNGTGWAENESSGFLQRKS